MARVYIDPHMFSEDWFKCVLGELLKCSNVVFSYGESQKILREFAKVRQALEFYKMVGRLRRRHDADANDLENHQNIIESTDCYKECGHCDDSHIFALIYVKPTPYVFSKDARMAKCRDIVNKHMDKRYCNFIVLSSDPIYRKHRSAIMS